MATKEERKIEGMKRLQYLASRGMEFKTPIQAFKNNKVGIFENQGGFAKAVYYDLYLNQGQEDYDTLIKAKEEFEEEYNSTVYLIQISHTSFGKCATMFYVSNNQEEWKMDWDDLKENCACCNVYNFDFEESEIGSIGFEYDRMFGGIYRTA